MKKTAFLLCVSLAFFSSGIGQAKVDVEQLKRDVDLLKENVENSNRRLADAMNQLTSIQQDLGNIKGFMGNADHFYDQQKKSLNEYDRRMSALEDKIGLLVNLLQQIKEGQGSQASKTPLEDQAKEFQRLLDFISVEDFNKAISGLQAFLQKYPKSNLASDAQYWIAESYYGLNDFKKAVLEYQNLIQKFPQSPKVKTALLKQGLSFFALKMYSDAKPFFEKVISDHPNTPEAARAAQKIKEIEKLSPVPAKPTAWKLDPMKTIYSLQTRVFGETLPL